MLWEPPASLSKPRWARSPMSRGSQVGWGFLRKPRPGPSSQRGAWGLLLTPQPCPSCVPSLAPVPHTPCPPSHTLHTHPASSSINTIHMLHSMNQRGHIINNYRKCFWVGNIQFCLKAQNATKRYTSLSSPRFLAASLPPQRSILWRYNYTCSKSSYTILIQMNSVAYYIHSNVP